MFQTGRKAYADLIDVAQRNFKAKDSPETSPNRINKGCRRKINPKAFGKIFFTSEGFAKRRSGRTASSYASRELLSNANFPYLSRQDLLRQIFRRCHFLALYQDSNIVK